MNSYRQYIAEISRIVREAAHLPLGPAPVQNYKPVSGPVALIFAPHPDDEVIIGGLPLRLRRELNFNVINVAVTQGSNKARQAERWQELINCCDHIGFGLVQLGQNGLEGLNIKARAANPSQWKDSVTAIAKVLETHKPKVIFFPHDRDWNSTHIGTHHLIVDALSTLRGFSCYTVETEFWGAMDDPNLMVESSEVDVADLIEALSFHVGEVRRNPYHVRLPAWLMDNVRRGGELVGGQGGAAPKFTFGTLYRLRKWENGGLKSTLTKGVFAGQEDKLEDLFV